MTCPPGRCWCSPASRRRRCRRPARPAWSTTSTTAWPGASSPCSSPATACRSTASASWPPLYPAVWGVGQLVTGALSDRVGRKWLIAVGMWTQALAIGLIAAVGSFWPWAAGALLLGAGTAMVYPTLLAAVGDVAHPSWRASAVGVYRLWRDGGFAVGALLAGVVADLLGLAAAI